ncbi:chorismate-binding protein [Luteimicrobium subarcticum]|uniref:Para-aminobenzoate synthetase component 1 n=1 Tax=Luteimicrobium subarcticum TaxID=620910 RepID=A0A2M8W434_9MICO|nr:chorismate-binding protein [Luteimicrobium subarcticum]PJI85668.1 para-aminobenzoate synthetase component 1 [Luteimicrobium subarcticum]
MSRSSSVASAGLGALRAHDVVASVDLREHPGALATGGPWFVVATFEGDVRAWRFARVEQTDAGAPADDVRGEPLRWIGPARDTWTTSLDERAYRDAVDDVRARIRDGEVYQANVCRVLAAALPATGGADGVVEPDAAALRAVLEAGNPAPYGGHLHVPRGGSAAPAWVVSASPELYLSVADGVVTSGPIKGTAAVPGGMTDKDRAENVMITDLVRNDLQRVCEPGTVEVTDLLAEERHPGLVHLVSRVAGRLTPAVGAPLDVLALLDATFPPASVTGAPKSSALRIIRRLEPVPRGPYCGAFGWVDVERGRAELAVAIRTFWWSDGVLRFGAGAGITWGSDPAAEWDETVLKARRLVGLASATCPRQEQDRREDGR